LRLAASAAAVVGGIMAVGLVFAGAPEKIAAGVRIDGVDVGGLTQKEARALLVRRSTRLAHVPVTFVAGKQRFSIRPEEVGITPDWGAAVTAAAGKDDGIGVVRGFRRLGLRLFPTDIDPVVHAYDAAVNYEVGLLASKIDRPHREARLVRHGLTIEAVHGEPGRFLNRKAATRVIVSALAGFTRARVPLPVRIDRPRVTVAQLASARTLARKALSAPVTLAVAGRQLSLTPKELAPMIQLPHEGGSRLALGGSAANEYFARLDRKIGRPARSASFAVAGDQVHIVPAVPGLELDVPRSAAAVLAAAEHQQHRVAQLVVGQVEAGRSTAAARLMGISGLVGSFETLYGGIANRIHNVQLVAHLVDGKLIAPGATFSFNKATGERTAAKGFLEAPVIINGELSTGLGGGVCQVSTTVFNAAYEAGLPITQRTNHALYISHYPLGRDATVDYPSVDLKFVNDTGHWLLLRTFVGPSSLVVSLYGTPQHRRVVTETAPLRVTGPPPIIKTLDKTLKPGTRVVEDYGEPSQATSVHRFVYDPDGKLLSEATWFSSYRSLPKVVLIGPKKPKPKPPLHKKKAAATSTAPVIPDPPH
jgi:vancomycin resistance protein YoaR